MTINGRQSFPLAARASVKHSSLTRLLGCKSLFFSSTAQTLISISKPLQLLSVSCVSCGGPFSVERNRSHVFSHFWDCSYLLLSLSFILSASLLSSSLTECVWLCVTFTQTVFPTRSIALLMFPSILLSYPSFFAFLCKVSGANDATAGVTCPWSMF